MNLDKYTKAFKDQLPYDVGIYARDARLIREGKKFLPRNPYEEFESMYLQQGFKVKSYEQ